MNHIQNYRRQLPNEAFRFITNTRFVKKEDLIPTSCSNCGGENSPYYETNCKKAQEYHIGVHDKIVDYIEQVLRQYKAVKVSKENHNRLYDDIQSDIAINSNLGERIYLDVGVTWYKEKYYKAKVKHYQGYEAKIIPIIVGKNFTLHKESHLFLNQLKVNMQTFNAEIGYKISRYAQMCNNWLYKKRNLEKETNIEEAPIGKLDMNKFAPLADLGKDNNNSEKETYRKILIPTKQMEQLSRLTK
ncbi:Reverse_transcriptase/endonuclease [Hexamita inflata]|uniref:Putative n=1 Tax=Hexamita inflata TaxID=28002 RepID=A0AA86TZ19_9EUKA|nr:Reverse transcriptase/endonuclease [Hexamita inflata]